MSITKIVLFLGFAVCLISCNNGRNKEASSADSLATVPISSSAAVEKNKDSTRIFIRTADLKFKVKNVINSTYDIENITLRQGGFVTYSNLASTISNVTTTVISND